jgi:hypothetical protein
MSIRELAFPRRSSAARARQCRGAAASRAAIVTVFFSMALIAAPAVLAQARSALQIELDRAETALAEGRAADALASLLPLESGAAGDPRYDFTLALAALDAAQPEIARRALDRVLIREPRFDGARLERVRAAISLGDEPAARADLQWILDNSPSMISRDSARELLRSLDARLAGVAAGAGAAASMPSSGRTWRLLSSVTLGLGHDSNANGSTADREFFGFSLAPRALAQESSFADVASGLVAERNDARGALWSLQARAGHRSYPSAHFLDQSVAQLGASYTFAAWGWLAGLGLGGSLATLDQRSHLGAANVELSLSRRLGDDWELAGLARAGFADYRQPLYEELDVRRYLWGAALQRMNLAGGRGRLGLALIGGRDQTLRKDSPWSNDRYGARLFGAWQLRPRFGLVGEASWLTSDYFGARGFFAVDRLDRQVVAAVAGEWRGAPNSRWVVSPQLRWTDNPSNVPLFEYDRVEVSLYVRREFR